MKKKILGILLIVILVLFVNIKNVYGDVDLTPEDYEGVTNNGTSDNVEGWRSYKEFVRSFLASPVKTSICYLLDLIRAILADWIQTLLDLMQTVRLGVGSELKLTYTRDDLKAYGNDGINKYTRIGDYEENGGEDWQKIVNVDEANGSQPYGFTADTEIPVIPVDFYNLAVGDVAALDANFLTGNQNHENGTFWMVLRNFFTTIIHIVIYLTAAVLLTSLIWHGINIIKGAVTPEEGVEHREGLQRFVTALIMLIGSVLIMAVGIFASQMIFDDMKIRNQDSEMPIRVNVHEEDDTTWASNSKSFPGVSFSTNITGYARFMSQMENVELYGQKAMYTFVYIILVWVNLFAVIIMFIRMVLMMLLGIVGPIIAALYALRQEGISPWGYGSWAKAYLALSFIQVIFALAYRLILESAII